MGRRVTFTEAQVRRAVKAAREVDPAAIVEVTRDGTIRILPAEVDRNRSDQHPATNDNEPEPWT